MTNCEFNIVLVHPEIPQNTGGIGRLCVSNNCRLHLIEPLGFSLEDKYVKRAGMDYWEHVDCTVHKSWEAFLESEKPETLHFFSTKGGTLYTDAVYPRGSYLVFGSEGAGLPREFYEKYSSSLVIIPMLGEFHRSLNVANAAAIGLYEAIRQQKYQQEK